MTRNSIARLFSNAKNSLKSLLMGAEHFLPHLLADTHALLAGQLEPLFEIDFLGLLEAPSNAEDAFHPLSVARHVALGRPAHRSTEAQTCGPGTLTRERARHRA